MVGNGVTNATFDSNTLVPFVHGMGLIPSSLFEVLSSLSFVTNFHEHISIFIRINQNVSFI